MHEMVKIVYQQKFNPSKNFPAMWYVNSNRKGSPGTYIDRKEALHNAHALVQLIHSEGGEHRDFPPLRMIFPSLEFTQRIVLN